VRHCFWWEQTLLLLTRTDLCGHRCLQTGFEETWTIWISGLSRALSLFNKAYRYRASLSLANQSHCRTRSQSALPTDLPSGLVSQHFGNIRIYCPRRPYFESKQKFCCSGGAELYSYLRAAMGSTMVVRLDRTYPASTATAVSSTATLTNVTGSSVQRGACSRRWPFPRSGLEGGPSPRDQSPD